MRLNAYLLAGDPSHLAESLSSYYKDVERVVVSYDRESVSWTGTELPVDECLAIVRSVDVEGKCVFVPGSFHDTRQRPMENETAQRRAALAVAQEGADWVLQLDTDEIMAAPRTFLSALDRAEARGAGALDYPSRWLYARVGRTGERARNRYLERSGRVWGPCATYPGPLAVAAGTRLTHARQARGVPHYRVDFRPWNTDPARGSDAIVDAVVPLSEGVVHYSWVRTPAQMAKKFGWSGHSDELPPRELRLWAARAAHPARALLTSPFVGPESRFRIARIEDPARGVV